jgi:tRNA/rRNA methyltransferase
MRNVRQFLSRVRLKKKEASMIRGICRKFLWYAGKRSAGANVEETSP